MFSNGFQMLIAAGGVVGSLGATILLVYRSVSANLLLKFTETKQMIVHQEVLIEKGLDNIYEQLRTINGRVIALEVGLAEHKDYNKILHMQEREETNRRFQETEKDIRKLEQWIDPRKGP